MPKTRSPFPKGSCKNFEGCKRKIIRLRRAKINTPTLVWGGGGAREDSSDGKSARQDKTGSEEARSNPTAAEANKKKDIGRMVY